MKRGVPKGVTVVPCKGDSKYRVALPKSAITEATAIDSAKRPRKSVTCRTLTEAQKVSDDPVAFVFPSTSDDVDVQPDNAADHDEDHDEDNDDDAADHEETAEGQVNADEVNADV